MGGLPVHSSTPNISLAVPVRRARLGRWSLYTWRINLAASVTGVHRLKHVKGLFATDFADAYHQEIEYIREAEPDARLSFRDFAHSRLRPLLALFGECKSRISESLDYLPVRHQRPFHTPAVNRLLFVDYGIAAVAFRAHSKCQMVLLAAATFCLMDKLSRAFFGPWHRSSGASLLLYQFQDGTVRALTMGAAHPPNAGVGIKSIGGRVVA